MMSNRFPHVRHALALWQLMNENDSPAAVGSDLIVLATHGRNGVARWLHGSIAEELSRTAQLPTLFVPPTARGFVNQANGKFHLSRVLVPVDHSPPPVEALDTIQDFISPINEEGVAIELMHVGGTGPLVRRVSDGAIIPVTLRTGDVVSTILRAPDEQEADLIAMPTAGHCGLLDALHGSTTERVLRHALCPVLAVPAGRAPSAN
jgi:nucleotide-binding universal stress UspA family protein